MIHRGGCEFYDKTTSGSDPAYATGAVFATTARVMADKLAQARRHYAAGCSAK